MIDQFEELFALVDDEQRDRFLDSLIALASDPRGRTRVLVTLRADFYDRPLMHPAFGRMMTGNVFNVTPLAADEFEAAALGTGAARRRHVRAGSVGRTDRRGQRATERPAVVPVHPHRAVRSPARTRRSPGRRIGRWAGSVGRSPVVPRRSTNELDPEQQEASPPAVPAAGHRRPGFRDPPGRGRLRAGHARCRHVTMHGALEAFVASRLLVRDRDAFSGALTVEVAHEALLSEWTRLRRWIDDGRDDLRQHAAYSLVVDEWLTAGRDPDYLLAGGRLDGFEQWRATTTMRLTTTRTRVPRRSASATRAGRGRRGGAGAQQARLRRRARRRAFALGAVAAGITTAAIVAVVAAVPSGPTPRIAARRLDRSG